MSEEASEVGDVKISAAKSVLAYFSGQVLSEPLSDAEVEVLRNSRLEKIIGHYVEHGEERLRTHLGLLLEQQVTDRPWEDTRQVRASDMGITAAGKEDIAEDVYADLMFGN